MDRRQFLLKSKSLAAIPLVLNNMTLSAIAKPFNFRGMDDASDRVLILIQLFGGNDGLNTVIPMDQYGNLYNARPNIIIPESNLITLTDTLSLHPVMQGFSNMFEDGQLGIIQSVGYTNQNRSHFRSNEIWTTASAADQIANTGWVGRMLDEQYTDYPDDYPNNTNPDPFAIAMGFSVSETCQGNAANFSMALNDPSALSTLAEGSNDELDTLYGNELAFLNETIAQTNAYGGQIQDAAQLGNNQVAYPDTELGEQLKNVALLISGGLQTKVYSVSLGGFDTHSAQVSNSNPSQGRHAELLATLSDAVAAFQEDLMQQGLEERVMGMTFSEFGRQIRSNGSLGTDHGTAAPLFVFGNCVNGTILGDNPEISDQVQVQEGVPMQFEFRDVYGSILKDWFLLDEPTINKILFGSYQYLPIVQNCNTISSTDEASTDFTLETDTYPNPFQRQTTISFSTKNEWVKLSIFDTIGQEIAVLTNQQYASGRHQIIFDGSYLPAACYYYRLQVGNRQRTRRMIKVD